VAFVGRAGELAGFRRALAGDARLVLVVGDAGVGKSRLARESMRRAGAEAGVVSVWGGCLPLAEKLPLLPVAEAMGGLSGLEDGRLLEAALGAAPRYAGAELARLLPGLGPGVPGEDAGGGGWRRERLFSGVADVLSAVAERTAIVMVVEDVQWADSATLDCLTFLTRPGRAGRLMVVATCRSDEVPLDAHVAEWLAHVRGSGAVTEIRLGPMSRGEVAEQVTVLAGRPPQPPEADELFARGEGNPFFTEQLVAAAMSAMAEGMLRLPAGLPARLAELLSARARRCGEGGRALLEALAVAGRPLTEAMLAGITAWSRMQSAGGCGNWLPPGCCPAA
jgi:predicted ATPase